MTLTSAKALLASALVLSAPASAWAAAKTSDRPTKDSKAASAPEVAPEGLDFDLLAPAEPAAVPHAEDLSKEVAARRTMLTVHQVLGITTLALLGATVAVGQLSYTDRFHGGDTGKYELPHKLLAYGTFGAFMGTGALALFAPKPYRKQSLAGGFFQSTNIHKYAMAAATLCMLTQVGLGIYTASREGYVNQQALGKVHLVTGYAAFGFMGLGVTALVF